MCTARCGTDDACSRCTLAGACIAGLYPAASDEYEGLAAAIERLNVNDASVTVRKETSDALGAGFR